MKTKHIPFFFLMTLVIAVSSCLTMKPKTIDDVYLSEISAENAQRLRIIEGNIINLKNEKDKIEKDLAVAEQMIIVSESEIEKNKANKVFLQENEKLYTISEEIKKLTRVQKELSLCEKEIKDSKYGLNLNKAKHDETEALSSVKKAELAVEVAELDYEKAKVAKEYQVKRPEKFDKDKIINVPDYEKFLNDQTSDLDRANDKHKKASDVVKKIEKSKESK